MTALLIILSIVLTSVLIFIGAIFTSAVLKYKTVTEMLDKVKLKPSLFLGGLLLIVFSLGIILSSLFMIVNNSYFEAIVNERAELGRSPIVILTITPTSQLTPTP